MSLTAYQHRRRTLWLRMILPISMLLFAVIGSVVSIRHAIIIQQQEDRKEQARKDAIWQNYIKVYVDSVMKTYKGEYNKFEINNIPIEPDGKGGWRYTNFGKLTDEQRRELDSVYSDLHSVHSFNGSGTR